LPSWSNETHTRHLLHSTRNALHRYRLYRLELNAITDPEQRYHRLVELNVIEQCLNLFKTGVVQKRRVDTYKEGGEYTTPQIHACVFDPKTGDMKKLPVRN
jgi:carbonic anhydrase